MNPPAKLYLPALVIVAVIMILLVFIGFSTYWNLNRARDNALDFVHQQGVAIAEAIEAGMEAIAHEVCPRPRVFEQLVQQTAQNRSVAYIYLVSAQGEFEIRSAGYERERHGRWPPDPASGQAIAGRFRRLSDHTPIYELAKRVRVGGAAAGTLVIGLKMSTFENARREDFHHAIIMVSILAALGAGTVFFIYVIQRYHSMNRVLDRTQQYTRQVVDNMANGLLSIAPDGRLLSWNALGLELLSLDAADPRDIRLDAVLDFERSGVSETLASCRPVMDREITVSTPSGKPRPLAVSVTPIGAAGSGCGGAVIILRDLREIKRLEEKVRRSEKLAALGRLAAAVAHEIRNPLSSIRGFARFLHHTLADRPSDAQYAEVMVREVDRINRVVTDLLNFARPLELEPAAVDPSDVVHHTVRLVSGDAQSRNIRIQTDTTGAPPSAVFDANLMTQVLLNLVLNAVEAAGPGGFVEVGAGPAPDTGELMFWVEDDGPGISPADLEKVFDPFFTTREKGTGLGLAIVQKIVEMHQGTVRFQSPPQQKSTGCRVEVRLPLSPDNGTGRQGI